LVYLANPGKSSGMYCYLLRMSRTGQDKVGVELPFGDHATANKDGVMALSQPAQGGNRVGLYDSKFRPAGGVGGFDPNGSNPGRVGGGPAAASPPPADAPRGAAPPTPAGKQLASYPLPDGQPKEKRKRTYRDFRVCEKTKAFHLFPHPDPGARIVCVGFD